MKSIVFTISILLLFLISGCSDNAAVYQERYQEGYNEGYSRGRDEGYENGMDARFYEGADFYDSFYQDLIWFYKEGACIVFPESKECHIFECELVQEMLADMEYREDANYSFFDQRTAKKMGYVPHTCLVSFDEDIEPVDLSIPE